MSHKDQQDAERGRLAAEVLNNPVYAEAFDLIHTEITNTWREASDAETREHLHRLQKCLTKVQAVLTHTMNEGKVASKSLEAAAQRGLMSRLRSVR